MSRKSCQTNKRQVVVLEKKNITFIGLNYAPEDTAIGLYSTQWVNFLKENGFNVTVITAFPYYPQWKIEESYKRKPTFFREEINDIDVIRYKQYVPKNPTFFKRIVHLIDFTFGSFVNLYKVKKSDLVISIVPFTSSILLGYIQKKRFKTPLWVHIQDFEFDAALQTGMGKKKNVVFSMLFKLEKWLFSKADITSTISQSMLKRLSEKTQTEQFFLPNWIDENAINPNNHNQLHPYLSSKKHKVLYSGNIGDKQDWEVFIKFCHDLDNDKFEIIVVGDGSKKDWLLEKIKSLENVNYYPPVLYKDLSNLLCSADIHVLFQKPEVLDTVMPSKVLGMMASAKPSILIGNRESEVKTILEISNGGLYYSKYSGRLIDDMNMLIKNNDLCNSMGNKARDYVIENFSKKTILSNMVDKLHDL